MAYFRNEIIREFEQMKADYEAEKEVTASYKLIKHYWKAYLNAIDSSMVESRSVEFVSTRDMFVDAVKMREEQNDLKFRRRDADRSILQTTQCNKIVEAIRNKRH